jgi:hypothetical protein
MGPTPAIEADAKVSIRCTANLIGVIVDLFNA